MRTFLTTDYFNGEIGIPNLIDATDSGFIKTELNQFIAKFEPEFMKKLLGRSLYADFLAGISTVPLDDKWTSLYNQIFYGVDVAGEMSTTPRLISDVDAPVDVVITKGTLLEYIVVVNKTANVGQLSGILSDDQVAFGSWGINAMNSITTIPVNKCFSITDDLTLTIGTQGDGDTFNGLTADIYLVCADLLASNPTGMPVLQSPAANYVYFKYAGYKRTTTTNAGEAQAKLQNAEAVIDNSKMERAWDRMYEMITEFREWINDNLDDYPGYMDVFYPEGTYIGGSKPRKVDPLGPNTWF